MAGARSRFPAGAIATVLALAPFAVSGESYSPYANRDFPENVFFGDTHLHTSVSLDSLGSGNTTIGPDEAYRWAKGETLAGDDGMPTRISRPLDFLMVADHAEYLGEPAPGQPGAGTSPWQGNIDAAEAHNQPGRFTAFIGFEYTPLPEGNNLHRVVIFRDGKERAGQVQPFSAHDSENPEDLWSYLQEYEEKTGGRVLAVPHNGNLSGGRMFALEDVQGQPLTRDYAERRMRWEPLYEVTQYKGDGETHPFLSRTDEFADFETWDKSNLGMREPHRDEYFQTEYARSALKLGLQQRSALGANPFMFGMIGSSDSHTGFAQVAEDNFLGKHGLDSPNPANRDRWQNPWPSGEWPGVTMDGWESQSGGLAAVWARENTREAIWDALQRKEVYATTGPRIRVRLFGGFAFDPADAQRSNMAAIGYARGVPMGGTLQKAPPGVAPTFLVAATRDPDGANLDRIQVIKGWLDDSGVLQERVYDVAASDRRTILRGVVSRKVGSTVDVRNALYSNSIGDAQLLAFWMDPEFEASQEAFYYARVIEIPTPRWTAYDQARLGAQMSPRVPMQLQERAYTSPIWYVP